MVRGIIGVAVGFMVWTAIWLGGNAALFGGVAAAADAGKEIASTADLIGLVALGVAASLAAGATAGAIARRTRPALVLGAVLLLVGVGVQASMWRLFPLWYEAAFLAPIVPATFIGGRFIGRGHKG
ncbi:hypothetical protein BH11PLA1_BH11PLA1_00950 [soil metagenome]